MWGIIIGLVVAIGIAIWQFVDASKSKKELTKANDELSKIREWQKEAKKEAKKEDVSISWSRKVTVTRDELSLVVKNIGGVPTQIKHAGLAVSDSVFFPIKNDGKISKIDINCYEPYKISLSELIMTYEKWVKECKNIDWGKIPQGTIIKPKSYDDFFFKVETRNGKIFKDNNVSHMLKEYLKNK